MKQEEAADAVAKNPVIVLSLINRFGKQRTIIEHARRKLYRGWKPTA
jgi:hypothetical protein